MILEDQDLQKLLDTIRQKYETELVPITVGSEQLRFLTIQNLDEVIVETAEKGETGKIKLPYWGKIWESSVVLAHFIESKKLKPGTTVLELGAGVGVVGLFAASWGQNVTITDNNDEALLFAMANAMLNDLQEKAHVVKLDWTNPQMDKQFDYIIGSEIIYVRETYPFLIKLFQRFLKPAGTIFLAKSTSLPAKTFFPLLDKEYKYEEKRLVMRSNGEKFHITIYTVRNK